MKLSPSLMGILMIKMAQRWAILFVLGVLAAPAFAAEQAPNTDMKDNTGTKDFTVAAVVNDHVITRYDITQRIRFILATTGLKPDPQTINGLFPRVMSTLIDEQLQRQEVNRSNVAVTPEEIDEAIARIEKDSKRPTGSLSMFLSQMEIDSATLEAQMQAQIGWAKLMQKRIVPQLRISEQEMARALEQNASVGRVVEEVKLASLVLANVQGASDAKTELLAKQVVAQLRQGVSFEAVARQLTSPQLTTLSPTWVPVLQLNPKLAEIVGGLTPPAVADPVRTPAGYQIVLLQDRRKAEAQGNANVMFKEIILTLPAEAAPEEVDVLMAIARDVRKNAGSCSSKNIAGVEELEDLKFEVNYTRTSFDEISPQVLPLVRSLRVSETSEPFATPEGIRLLQLCEKTVLPVAAPDRARMERKLKEQKFTLEALRALRDLRRDAYIDVRL
jgi:peptidyl-prolyl cis-trans isomerase SurA